MSTDLDALVPYLRAIEHHLARCAEALERLAEIRDEEATVRGTSKEPEIISRSHAH